MGFLAVVLPSCGRISSFLLKSCTTSAPLYVRLEALTPSYLASCRVGTPDPNKQCGFCGEQLVVAWNLSHKPSPPNFEIIISYITGVHQFEQVKIPVCGSSGAIRYKLLNEDYKRTQGFLSYKVELFQDNELQATWKPRSWVEWIPTE